MKEWDHKKVSKIILEKCEKLEFYLGVDNHVSDEYGYKWRECNRYLLIINYYLSG